LFETRKATEAFSSKLTQRNDTNINMTTMMQAKQNFDIVDDVKPTNSLFKRFQSYVGLAADDKDKKEDALKTVFCYSLFYVYYDQYTYITGVLAQNIALGMIAIFFAIQVSTSFAFPNFILSLDSKLLSNFHIYLVLRVLGFL